MNNYQLTTINLIGASQTGGDIVSGCCYTYRFARDYPSLRIWRCPYRCVKFPRCNSTLKQIGL
jgi:hypothetical protein